MKSKYANKPKNAIYKNKEWLEDKHINEKLSTNKLAKKCQVVQNTIWYWLKKFDIPIRSVSEGNHIRQANYCNLSQDAIEWINGELLGDGCLKSYSPYSAKFQYSSKYLEYCEYIRDTLKSFGIKQSGKIYKRYHKKYKNYDYNYHSLDYAELLYIYKQWYPKGKKIVPRDIELSPLKIRQWMIGDGSLVHRKDGRPYIKLATSGFMASDVRWLVKQLVKLGFKATRQSSNNEIGISAYSVRDFLNYMGKCPVECYKYKFEY